MKAFPKFTGYILLKWALFYLYQFIEGSTKWSFNKANSEGVFLAVFMLIALPLVELVILFYPLQLALRTKGLNTILLLIASFSLEFAIGWFITNQHFAVWMVVKIILSMLLFGLMYRKQLIKNKARSN